MNDGDHPDHGLTSGVSVLTKFRLFSGPNFYAVDELHTVARGVGLLLVLEMAQQMKQSFSTKYNLWIRPSTSKIIRSSFQGKSF